MEDVLACALPSGLDTVRPWDRGMHVYRTETSTGWAEGQFDTAVYRFLELHSPQDHDLVIVHTEVTEAALMKSVQLWSAEAVAQFASFWSKFQHDQAAHAPFSYARA